MRKPHVLFSTALIVAVFLMAFRYDSNTDSSYKKYAFDHRMLLVDTLFEGSNSYFASSGVCDNCHGFDPNGIASVDMEGTDINVVDDWRSSMMANSARDPFWRAKVSHEVFINPALQEEIESTCTRCHAPLGNYAATINGADHYSFAEMLLDSVALDGVSCLACHQRSPENLNGHNGMMQFASTNIVYGQYENPLVTPMFLGSGYVPEFGAHIAHAEICGSCHSLITSTVDLEGNLTGSDFVEQATWHEWLNSSYPEIGTTCQDCHMPSLGEQGVILAKGSDTPPRSPYSLHTLVGGNAFMLGLLRDNADALSLTASSEQFETTRLATVQNLQNNSLQFVLNEVDRDADTLRLEALLTNITGHKLPSGYPARRMVVNIEIRDSLNNMIWTSGAFDNEFYVIGENAPFEPHYQTIRDENEVQIYEMVMGDVNGNFTTVLERANSHLKDNRLVPLGFSTSNEVYDTTEIVLGIPDPDFNHNPGEGSGTDKIRYHIALNGYAGEIEVRGAVYYQSIPPIWLEEIFSVETDAINEFQTMYDAADKTPVLMKSTSFVLEDFVSTDDFNFQKDINCFSIGTDMVIESNLSIQWELYSVQGSLIQRGNAPRGYNRYSTELAYGTYIIVLNTAQGSEIKKLMIGKRP